MKPNILYSVKTKDGNFEANVFQNNRGFAVEMRDNEVDERIGDVLKIFDSLEKAKKYADGLLRHEDLEEHRSMHRTEKGAAAEYQGKKVTLNKPTKGDTKKYKVYVKDNDKVKKVEFGDPNLEIKRDNPERRKNFRSRHKCDTDPRAKDKTTPKYWSCRFWEGGTTVTELLNKKSHTDALRKIADSLKTADSKFSKWLDTFIEEKGIDPEEYFTIQDNHIPYGVVLEHIKIAPSHEQEKIKDMLVKIDFKNGDVKHFLRHLSQALL